MTRKEMSKIIEDAVHKAYEAGYKDGYFDGANGVMDRVEEMRLDYKTPDYSNWRTLQ